MTKKDYEKAVEDIGGNEEHTCETCAYGSWKRKGWTMDMSDDKCGGCCSWNDKWEAYKGLGA